jgi:hypothetical protein
MHSNLNQVLCALKLKSDNFQPNINEIVNQVKLKEIDYHRTKVISLSQAVLKNPNNRFRQGELKSSLERLEYLYTA